MIINELAKDSARTRNTYYSLFNPEGKAYIRALLQQERALLNAFELNYDTPELRKMDYLAKNGKATEEQLAQLEKAKKKFVGRTPRGMIQDPKTIRIVSGYINNLKAINEDLKSLGDGGAVTDVASDEVILGKPMTYWNLHPAQLYETIYDYLFSTSGLEYLQNELIKLFGLKAKEGQEIETTPIYDPEVDDNHLEGILLRYTGSAEDKDKIKGKLYSLNTVGKLTVSEYRAILEKLLNRTLDEDLKFEYDQYKELKEILPQYNKMKTNYMVTLLTQFNQPAEVKVNNSITFEIIMAFMRKVDELLDINRRK